VTSPQKRIIALGTGEVPRLGGIRALTSLGESAVPEETCAGQPTEKPIRRKRGNVLVDSEVKT